MSDNKKDEFVYSYCAPTESQRREISDIVRQYIPKDVTAEKLAKLRKLDAAVKSTAVASAVTVGVIGTLLFGTGLAMILEWFLMAAGIVVALAGAAVAGAAYPIYKKILKRNKRKYGPEILRLSEELLGADTAK